MSLDDNNRAESRLLEFTKDKQILITGGSGSFGHAFLRFILRAGKPRRVVIFSRDEYKQSLMQRDFRDKRLRFFLGDVRDADRLKRAFKNIDIVIHAAALKQVPAAEYNPLECILTNVIGAENVIKAALDSNVERVLALSTDKAVNPINLYGAAKLCADKLFVAANNLSGERGAIFSIVRYGNVLGSRGSVVPFFQEQAQSGVIPITDERMTRFWISLDDSVRFVLRCLSGMRGGEIFVPKIPSMRIVDLARAIAPDARLRIIGLRAGEKIHEVLLPLAEARYSLAFDDHYVIRSRVLEELGDGLGDSLGDGQRDSLGGVEAGALELGRDDDDRVRGRAVAEDFEYSSETNEEWLSEGKLSELLAVGKD